MKQFQNYNLDQSLTMLQKDEPKKSKIHYPPNVVQLDDSIPQQFVSNLIHKGKEIKVHVGDVGNPSQFWITLKAGYLDASDLMYYIQEVYFDHNQSEELKISEEDVTQGMFCVALYEEEYNRGFVKKVIAEERKVEVFFVDYGTVSLIDANKLYFLLEKFSYLPQQAIQAKLAGVRPYGKEWSKEAVQTFSSLVGMFKELTAKIVWIDRTNKTLKVILIDDQNGESVGDALVKNKFAYVEENLSDVSLERADLGKSQIRLQDRPNFSSQNDERIKLAREENLSYEYQTEFHLDKSLTMLQKDEPNQEPLKSKIRYPPNVVQLDASIPQQFVSNLLNKNKEIKVHVGDVGNPSQFWITLKAGYLDASDLMYYIQEVYFDQNESEELKISEEDVTQGMFCVALYEEEYNRGLVKKVIAEQRKVEVFFVDYGTVSLIDANKLYFLLEKFSYLPQQAIQAKLAGVRPYGKEWSNEAVQTFSGLVGMFKELTAKIVWIDRTNKTLKVILIDDQNGENVGDALVKNKFAYVEENLSDVSSERPDLCKLQNRPNFSYQNGERIKLALEGNFSYEYQTEFRYPPDVAKPRDFIRNQFLTNGTFYEDQIQICVAEIVNPSNFWLISTDGFENLVVLLDKMYETYTEKSTTLVIPEEKLKRGMYCVASYENEFGRAVVRKIMIEENQVEVFFVDFGTILLIDSRELFFILKEFMDLPAQAVKARLVGIRPLETDWSADATKKFSSMVYSYKVMTAKLVNIDWYKRILDVTLVDSSNGVCINTALVENNLALNETFHEPLTVYKSVNGIQNPSSKLGTIPEE